MAVLALICAPDLFRGAVLIGPSLEIDPEAATPLEMADASSSVTGEAGRLDRSSRRLATTLGHRHPTANQDPRGVESARTTTLRRIKTAHATALRQCQSPRARGQWRTRTFTLCQAGPAASPTAPRASTKP